MPFDPMAFRRHFPSLAREVGGQPAAFFDGPGGSQVPLHVMDAQRDYYLNHNANTHGQFATSRETDALIAQARIAMAEFLGAESADCISFGQNMTTLNFALAHAIGRTLAAGDEIIVTELDHDANVAPWLGLAERGAHVRFAPVRTEDCTLDMDALLGMIGERTRLVALGYASNAVGTVQDVARVVAAAHRRGALVVVDAVHFAPHASIDVRKLQCDFLLCSAYKFFGPHVGILYSRPGALQALPTDRVRPQDADGPARIETGTLNPAALAGVTAAVDLIASFGQGESRRQKVVQAFAEIYPYEHALAGRLWNALRDLERVHLYGTTVGEALRAPTVSFRIAGLPPEEIARRLGDEGLFVWDGDFYAVTLIARLGLSDRGGVVRVGMAPYVTESEVDRLLEAIRRIAA